MDSHTLDVPKQIVPDILIYEMDEGQPIYYRGYQNLSSSTLRIYKVTYE